MSMDVIIPMAGLGTRFSRIGINYTPKPLIEINGKRLVEWAISSLGIEGTYHFVIPDTFTSSYERVLMDIASKYVDKYHVYRTKPTRGALETSVVPFVHNNIIRHSGNNELVITNCDQFTPWNINSFLDFKNSRVDLDAIVTTYNHQPITVGETYPYSFIKLNESGYGVEVSEKYAISENALCGIHYWRDAKDFLTSATDTLSIDEDDLGTNEYYLSTSFNSLIGSGMRVGIYKLEDHEFYSLGSPEEIDKNLSALV